MSLYQGDYIRVMTPQTLDGVTPLMENDRLVLKESHGPMELKAELERQNDKLPIHLRHRIEVVRTGFGNVNTPQATQTKQRR